MEHESQQTALVRSLDQVPPTASSDTAIMEKRTDIPREEESLDPRAETFVALKRAHEHLTGLELDLFKKFGLSAPQFSVLTVLRDADGGRLSCGEISRRLIHRVPDVTRLVDRLQKAELVTRNRRTGDARVVEVRITQKAAAVLEELDRPVRELMKDAFQGLDRNEMASLLGLLKRLVPDTPR